MQHSANLWNDKVKMQLSFFFFGQPMTQMTKSHFCEVKKKEVNNATVPGLQGCY